MCKIVALIPSPNIYLLYLLLVRHCSGCRGYTSKQNVVPTLIHFRKRTHRHLIFQDGVSAIKKNTATEQGVRLTWDTILDRLVNKLSLEHLSPSHEWIERQIVHRQEEQRV